MFDRAMAFAFSFKFSTIDLAIGCELLASILNSTSIISCSSPSKTFKDLIENLPVVKVPVLSNIIVFVFANSSRVLPPFIKIPFLAALPIPTITAVGVARPIAQGQEITSTAIACSMLCCVLKSKPNLLSRNVVNEIPSTIGTKMALILSPNR